MKIYKTEKVKPLKKVKNAENGEDISIMEFIIFVCTKLFLRFKHHVYTLLKVPVSKQHYSIPLSYILIQKDWWYIRPEKMTKKIKWYNEKKEFQSPILLNKDCILVDGFSSYRIAQIYNIKVVPIIFVD